MRFYGFKPAEVVDAAGADGMLPLDIDPKLAWAPRQAREAAMIAMLK